MNMNPMGRPFPEWADLFFRRQIFRKLHYDEHATSIIPLITRFDYVWTQPIPSVHKHRLNS